MKVQNPVFFSIAMFFALTAASFAQQVKTDYDHNANFGQYKTYSWEKVETKDPLMVDRIKDAANSPAKARIASSDSQNVTIKKCAVSPSMRRSA
jgi:hypothetical protein